MAYSNVAICERCGRAVDLRTPGESLKGWQKIIEKMTTPVGRGGRPLERPYDGGDVCPECAGVAA